MVACFHPIVRGIRDSRPSGDLSGGAVYSGCFAHSEVMRLRRSRLETAQHDLIPLANWRGYKATLSHLSSLHLFRPSHLNLTFPQTLPTMAKHTSNVTHGPNKDDEDIGVELNAVRDRFTRLQKQRDEMARALTGMQAALDFANERFQDELVWHKESTEKTLKELRGQYVLSKKQRDGIEKLRKRNKRLVDRNRDLAQQLEERLEELEHWKCDICY